MKNKLIIFTLMIILGFSAYAADLPEVGKMAPDFELQDTNFKSHKLSDYRGKIIVLEWLNHDCPFVKKHYVSQNMQKMQSAYTQKDVIWFSINSTAQDSGDYKTEEQANELNNEFKGKASAILQDDSGKVGRLYGAKTTPHMFVIDQQGVLKYMGAIDSKRSTDPEDIPGSTNYVMNALNSLLLGREVSPAATKPYGCSVKY